MKIIIILRKKTEGENSMEEIAYSLKNQMNDTVSLYQLPYDSHRLVSIIKNIHCVKRLKADIFHVFSISEGYLVPFLKNCLLTCHDVNTIKYLKKKWKQKVYLFINVILPSLFAKKITCVSSQTKNEFESIIPLVRKKLLVINNPINKGIQTKRKEFNQDYPIILHIGTAYRKNLNKVIESLKDIPAKLVIVGKLKEDQILLLQENKICYDNEVDISFERIIQLYECSDIVSFPSSYEGFGMPLIEANKVGRAVLGSNIQVFADVSPGAYLKVDQNDVKAIREGFITLIHNAKLREELIYNGLNNVEKYSIEAISQEYSNLYKSFYKE